MRTEQIPGYVHTGRPHDRLPGRRAERTHPSDTRQGAERAFCAMLLMATSQSQDASSRVHQKNRAELNADV